MAMVIVKVMAMVMVMVMMGVDAGDGDSDGDGHGDDDGDGDGDGDGGKDFKSMLPQHIDWGFFSGLTIIEEVTVIRGPITLRFYSGLHPSPHR